MDSISYEKYGVSRDINKRRLQWFSREWLDADENDPLPTTRGAMKLAKALLFEIRSSKLEPQIFPLMDGGLQFEWDIDNFYLELEIHDNEFSVFAINKNGQYPYGEDGTPIEADPRMFVDVYLTKHFRL